MYPGPTQKKILPTLIHQPHTTRGVASAAGITMDSAHHSLRRLEDAEFVRRTYDHPHYLWELTNIGRQWVINHSNG